MKPLNLFANKYTRDILIKNIYGLSLIDILKTQDIDENFIINFILNPNYHMTEEEEQNINIPLILMYYPNFIEKITDLNFIYKYEKGPLFD